MGSCAVVVVVPVTPASAKAWPRLACVTVHFKSYVPFGAPFCLFALICHFTVVAGMLLSPIANFVADAPVNDWPTIFSESGEALVTGVSPTLTVALRLSESAFFALRFQLTLYLMLLLNKPA